MTHNTGHITQDISKGQATLEFVFCFLVVLLILYSCVKAFQWLGITLVKPHLEHQAIYSSTDPWYLGPSTQLNRPSEQVPTMHLLYYGNVMKGIEND